MSLKILNNHKLENKHVLYCATCVIIIQLVTYCHHRHHQNNIIFWKQKTKNSNIKSTTMKSKNTYLYVKVYTCGTSVTFFFIKADIETFFFWKIRSTIAFRNEKYEYVFWYFICSI